MRIAIFADIHANLVALETVLADIERQSVDRVVCLGDVAASGPQPHETIRRLEALEIPVVMGNADAWLLEPEPYKGQDVLHRMISEVDSWCTIQLTTADMDFLRSFRATIEIPLAGDASLLCYHGSPHANTDIVEAGTSEEELERLFSGFQALVMAGGHTHAQMLRRYRESILINPGSVGLGYERSHSGDSTRNVPWAEYAQLEWEDGSLNIGFRRVPLDVLAVRQAALQSSMPHADWWASEWRE